MSNGLVDLVDSGLELLAGEAIVAAEGILEGFQLALEVGHIDALAACDSKLALVVDGLLGGVHQKGDDGFEELGADDVHLRVAMGDIHNTTVVQLAFRFQEGHQHCVFATLSVAVRIELPEEVLVLVLGGRILHFVFHFEHDGDVLLAIIVVTEDEVSFTSSRCVIVLLEIGVRK